MGAYQGFIDGATGSGVAADRRREIEAAHFDAIVGATVPSASAAPVARPSVARPSVARPSVARPSTSRPSTAAPSARRRPVPALGVFAALSVAGVVLAGGVIVGADALVHGPLTSPTSVLSAATTADTVSPASAHDAPTASPYGSTVALGDDLAVSISAPSAYSPSSRATGTGGAVDVVSTVTITNVSGGDVDPAVAFAATGTTGTRVFDRPNGIRLNALSTLAPGQSVTYRVAFSVGSVPKLGLLVSDGGRSVVISG